jgi:hypothetical protein
MKQDSTTSQVARGNGYAVSRDLNPKIVPLAGLMPLGRETRKHPPQQVRKSRRASIGSASSCRS